MSGRSLLQGIFPDPGIKPRSPALQTNFLPSEPPEEPWRRVSIVFLVINFSCPLIWFSVADIINYQKLDGLSDRNFILVQF